MSPYYSLHNSKALGVIFDAVSNSFASRIFYRDCSWELVRHLSLSIIFPMRLAWDCDLVYLFLIFFFKKFNFMGNYNVQIIISISSWNWHGNAFFNEDVILFKKSRFRHYLYQGLLERRRILESLVGGKAKGAKI